MNAERLLEQYEKIADAPDVIARLRRFILELAVRGKLAPQDPKDEPASVLLEKVASEKERLEGGRARRRLEPIETSPKDIVLFSLPKTWLWLPATYPALAISEGDRKVQTKDVLPSGLYPVIDQGKVLIRGYCNDEQKVTRVSSPIILFGDHTRETKLIDFDFVVGADGVKLLQPVGISASYYFLALNWLPLESRGYGRHFKLLKASRIPLPPLAEQHRIVDKVDELMVLCDQLEAAREAREATRDQLAAASLARLNTPDPESFADDARFALDTLPALTARPDQIKQLRQTILNLAVRGKLVPQDPKDEPAEEFDKALPSILTQPFSIPSSWKWSRLSCVGKLRGGGTPSKSKSEFWDGKIPWVSPKDMKVDYISDAQMAITEKAVQESSVNLIDQGSLLFVVRGMILAHSFPVAVTQEVVTVNQDMKALIPKEKEMAEYFLRALKGLKPQMLARVQRSSHGTCRLEGSDYADFLIPIPPLSEQHRIVAKVDELLAICDQLEARLATAGVTRGNLLDALFAEALTPANNDQRREAAE
ncbi:restriction endonuclease subunit S [Rhizobium leguminosarum]|uniref:restriction endonuclease subunit S n=1 Tax=Rhizobium leguminosarum TaxID=384 RepID=UPI001C97256D|nr:restriction endonuclease subunit S [Rhizobium leguminosarum]MBY5741922.1 type I restriction endonuclease subunit S [Rhizobium leguminosarum]